MYKQTRLFGLSLLIGATIAATASSPALAWSNSQGEEDWGPSCFLEQAHKTGRVMIMTGKDGFVPAMYISNTSYPKAGESFSVSFTIQDGRKFTRAGSVDDYFGEVYIALNQTSFDRLRSAQSVTITYSDESISVPLSAAAAFEEFVSCANG